MMAEMIRVFRQNVRSQLAADLAAEAGQTMDTGPVEGIARWLKGCVDWDPTPQVHTVDQMYDGRTGDCKSYTAAITAEAQRTGQPYRWCYLRQSIGQAHVWAQVKDGSDWRTYDPTPGHEIELGSASNHEGFSILKESQC